MNNYKPDVVIAINGGGSFLSMLLGSKAPTLSVIVSNAPNLATNENNFLRIQQWFDESSNEGLRVNNSRVLLVADSEIASGMLNFVSKELSARSVPSQIAAVLLHKEQSASASDAIEIVSGIDTSPNSRVHYPWNSGLSYSQHETKVAETEPIKIEHPEEGYWDWPAEDTLSISQIEKHLISDSKRRQKESEQIASHSEPEVQSYWDWEVKELSPTDILKDIMEYEKIRPTFSIEHIEEKLKTSQKKEDVCEHQSTRNIFLGNNSDYWTWDTEAIDKKSSESPLPNIKQEDRIQKLLSVEHIEQQLKDNLSKEESKVSNESPYWSWTSSNNCAESQLEEYLERLGKDKNAPHEEEKSEQLLTVDVDVEKEIIAFRNAMNPAELMQWVLNSCQLGLIPSSDILRKLLLSNQKQEAAVNASKSNQKQSVHESESYWDESPATDDNEIESYWDERPANIIDGTNEYACLEKCFEADSKKDVMENTKHPSNDNERASVAAYYLTMLNKDASITPAPRNEEEERASLAEFYRQQVNVTVAPVVQKEAMKAAAVGNKNADYWDEKCAKHDMEEDDKENYWDL